MKGKKPEKAAPGAEKDKTVRDVLVDRWSSHPRSLEKQRKWWFAIGLIPVAAVFGIIALLLTGTSGWRLLASHPTTVFLIVGGAVSAWLGMMLSFALLHLVARARLAKSTDDPDRLPFPRAMVVLFAFFWLVPASLSFIQAQWGVRLVPQQMLFVLSALCFAPFVLLLLWVRFASGDGKGENRKARRPVWFVLGTLLLGLAGLSLVGDLQGWARSLKLPPYVSGLSTLVLRAAALATLLPLSMVCYAVWSLFRRTMAPKEEEHGEEGRKRKKSAWSRLMDFLRGLGGKPEPEEPEPEDDAPPKWLAELCAKLPPGVRVATKNPPAPDSVPAPETPMSDVSKEEDADPFWILMGGSEDRRPTDLQVRFFERFRKSVEEVREAEVHGNEASPDIVLAGDEGSGRTEALLAAAMFAAFVRRQRVLYLVSDPEQARTLSDKANRRFREVFLDCFLRAGMLDGEKARRWVGELASRPEPRSGDEASGGRDGDIVPPNILFATPRDVERVFFEGRGADADASSIDALRALIRLFEVVLVDDFMELDMVERAHLPFLLHKLRMILVSGNLRPQFVVVLPRLRGKEGLNVVSDRLFGSRFNPAGNAITLLPRRCEPAWSLPLVVADGLDVGKTGEDLVRLCLGLSTDVGEKLRVVLYRKNLLPHQCRALEASLAPDKERLGNIKVVSRLDEIDAGGRADAVFYLTANAGRADMALRLSVGDGKTVYLSVSSESEAVLGDDADSGVLPAIPDSTAVALRVHHLRSLLRFVVPGQPVDVSAWERFGVSLSGSGRLRQVDLAAGGMVYEQWRHDEWNEPAYGQRALWPYVAFESEWSVKSNAGKGTDFNVLPYADEDVVRLGDEPLIGLVRPKSERDGEVADAGVGAGSLAKMVDVQGAPVGFLDLAHAEALVLGRSALGDIYTTSDNKSVETVLTAEAFEPPEKEDGDSCVCRLRMTRPWNGDGTDFDTPVRSLSWTVETVSVPKPASPVPGRTFAFFDLPECHNLPRIVSGEITGRANRIGQEIPEQADEKARRYSYPAYFSGLLLAPRSLGRKDGPAKIQRGVVGPWNTEDGSFSVVLTHLLAGVLMRIVPDLPFYACIPVFHQRGRYSAVAPAVAWFVQPLNSGKAVDGIVRDFIADADGQSAVQKALAEARRLFESRPDAESRLRWLRSFSRSAFTFDLEEPGRREAFEQDVAWSLEVLDVLDRRLSGVLAEIEEFKGPVPDIVVDHSWMSRPRTFDSGSFQPDSVWKVRTEFPEPPALGRPGASLVWHYGGKEFSLQAGFSAKEDGARYNGFLDRSLPARIWGDSYTEYGFNDPYREFVGDLCAELRRMAAGAFPGATPTQLAEFLLSFVQEGLPYEPDPEKESDWPRHPSETLMRFGGDCEDSSILYAELLRRFRIEGAILSVPEHAAVGVNVPLSLTADRQEPIAYTWLGKTYVYAETACSQSLRPLGSKTGIIRSAKDVPADVIPTPDLAEDANTPVRVLDAFGLGAGTMEITLVAPAGTTGPLAVAVFARPRKDVFAEPDPAEYPCIGGAMLPALPPRKVFSAAVAFAEPDFPSFWYDVFVCEPGGTVRGHFVGVPSDRLGEYAGYEKSVSCDVYRDHVLFRAKERGNVKRCRGKVHLRVFFVDDADSSWDDSARDVCRGVLADVARTLEREAGPAAGLEVSWSAENRRTDRSCSDMDLAHSVIPALLGVSGRPGVSRIQNEFKKAHGCDEAPLLFVWNRKFRSCCEESDSPRRHAEWATIGLNDDIHGGSGSLLCSILHELLHLFGAVDYYYPAAVKEAAMKWLPGSVMNEGVGMAIDDLTRVLVGWDDTLTPAAVSFLEDTRHVTVEEINAALAEA